MPRLVLATLALLGLVAMHGFGGHGVHSTADDVASGHGSHGSHGSHDHGVVEATLEAVETTGTVIATVREMCADGCSQHAGALALGLCVAILLSAILLLGSRAGLALLLSRGSDRWRLVASTAARRRRRPPDLFALSILRC